jgi:transcriptional regulator with XRE-family HTH domain
MAKAKKLRPEIDIEAQIMNLGKRLRNLRKDKGFTNYEFFAYENRIGRSQYGKYEQGVDMQFSSILRLMEIHGLTVKEFFSEGFD